MKTQYINELLNSGITLTEKDIAIVEEYIFSQSKPVKPERLNHYKCVAACRGQVA